MIRITLAALLTLAASTDDLPPQRAATMWVVRVEGMTRKMLVPIELMEAYGLKPGATVSLETARLLAQELGAEYPPEIKKRLEELGD